MSTVVTMRDLLEAGVHFGHQTKRGHPKMKRYIYTSRNDIHVLDLQKTIRCITDAYNFIRATVASGGKILMVGTKKQAQEAIRDEANRGGMPYVNQRWLGGTLTNFKTIRRSVRRMKHIQKLKTEDIFHKLPPKEQASLNREVSRLDYYLSGISEMQELPLGIFVIDTHKEGIAVKEAARLKIPVIGVVDTNCDPTGIQYPIPANDDAIRSIKLLTSIIANAAAEGTQNAVSTMKAAPISDQGESMGDLLDTEGFDLQTLEEKMRIEEDFQAEIVPVVTKIEEEKFVEVAEG